MDRIAACERLLRLLDHHLFASGKDMPVLSPLSPAQLREKIPLRLPPEGISLEELQDLIGLYLDYTVNTAHPLYLNQLWGGVDLPCVWGDLVTSVTNTSMFTYEVAPVATLIEQELIRKMGSLVGFGQVEGQFTTGGSNGNLMAMAMARYRKDPDGKSQGMRQHRPLVALVSAEAHYSFEQAAHLLGLGTDHLWRIPTDPQGRMVVAEAERLIRQAKAGGACPFFLAATAGTTVQGAFDLLPPLTQLAHQEDLWLHVDGAWGSSVLLSPNHRHLLQGVEQADSLVWDAHKMMGMTLPCSVLLINGDHQGLMTKTFASGGRSYLFHETADPAFDLGLGSMHCGRRVDALKLWLTWKHLGDRGWAERIDRYFQLAQQAETWIQSSPHLQLVTPRQSLNLCFQYVPEDPSLDRNQLVLEIRQRLLQEGIAMVNYAQIVSQTVFRLVLCNNQTQPDDLDRFFTHLVRIGHELEIQTRPARL
ncbi:MAG: aminotransferase class V-fold PLP-dependent enzyme [Synechococcaceae cyanobacterium SM2_3_1]|nr:aminotransferase class V-fold PLP-dependent enzyme [Synechococcaceae cyanobacterium SM2_3_1]